MTAHLVFGLFDEIALNLFNDELCIIIDMASLLASLPSLASVSKGLTITHVQHMTFCGFRKHQIRVCTHLYTNWLNESRLNRSCTLILLLVRERTRQTQIYFKIWQDCSDIWSHFYHVCRPNCKQLCYHTTAFLS